MDPDEVLDQYHGWLYRTALDLLPANSPLLDDLVQEGRVSMWRALDTFDASKGALPTWLTGAARQRMRDVAHGHGQPTGHEAMRGSRAVTWGSLEAELAANPAVEPTWDPMASVELSAHREEIADAVADLTQKQREYVWLRFWLGVDPTSRLPSTRAIVEQYPVLKEKWHWTRARASLRESLAHLESAA